MERKYSVAEIDAMRRDVGTLCARFNVSYDPKKRTVEIEERLRTYMANGTAPEEVRKAASEYLERQFAAQEAQQKFHQEQRAKAPPPRVLRTKEDVIDEWFQTSVARYNGATAEAKELYDGFSGHTLKRFANRHAPDGVNVTQRDMERYLDAKGIKSRNAMFSKRYDGIRHIIHGNVRSGNYGT